MDGQRPRENAYTKEVMARILKRAFHAAPDEPKLIEAAERIK